MATVIVKHHPSGGPADPLALVDGPTYDADPHIVTGLENVDNTADANKPVSTAQAAADAVVAANAAAALAAEAVLARNASNLTSGTVAAALLPAPTASTLGGIESLAAVSHNWINSISTAGVPAASQPAIGDISGYGTGVLTAIAVNVGSAGAVVVNGGVLGTPSSGTLTNCTGLPLAGLAAQAAWTFVFNNTSGSASPTAGTIDGLTLKGTPAAADEVMIWDVAGAAIKKATVTSLTGSSGVSSLNSNTGALNFSVVIQKFTAGGTYTPTTGMVYCIVEVQAAGGGGGGTTGSANCCIVGASGGAGEYTRTRLTAAQVGASQTATIGAVGTAGAAAGAGGTAADSSIGTLATAKGGAGGAAGTSGGAGLARASGGSGGTGDVAFPGGDGSASLASSGSLGSVFFMSQGGNSHMGQGGLTINPGGGATGVGAAGKNYGGGGGGGISQNVASNIGGGAGGPAIIIITEYIIH